MPRVFIHLAKLEHTSGKVLASSGAALSAAMMKCLDHGACRPVQATALASHQSAPVSKASTSKNTFPKGPTGSQAGVPTAQPARGMPKVPSLLFDMEMEEPSSSQCEEPDTVRAVTQSVKQLTTPAAAGDLPKLVADVDLAITWSQQRSSGAIDTAVLAHSLKQRGYAVTIRHCLGGGDGDSCLKNLRHSFLSCCPGNAAGCQTRYIIDPHFREQFQIAHPSARYASILEALPAAYVGPEDRIPPLVELLCWEMSLAFKAAGSLLPPWRHVQSMMSKWLPRRSLDQTITADLASGVLAGGLQNPQPCSAPPKHMNSGSSRQANSSVTVSTDTGSRNDGNSSGVSSQASVCLSSFAKPAVAEPQRRFVGGNFVPVPFSPKPICHALST
eukprot:jgi/Chrzof1/8398/Cz03g09060.t1